MQPTNLPGVLGADVAPTIDLRTAVSQGLGPYARRRLVRAGAWTVVRPGRWLTDGGDPADLHLALLRTALDARPGAVASHWTAAWLHGLTDDVPDDVHLTWPGRCRSHRNGLQVHRTRLSEADRVGDLTTPARTVLDLACAGPAWQALAAADRARKAGAGADDLLAAVTGHDRRPGARAAARVATLADPRSESVLESRSRWVFAAAGLDPPQLQTSIWDDDGFVARVDFCWAQAGLVGEADGLAKYDELEVLRREKLRQDRLADLGWTVVRWTWRDVADPRRAARLVDRLHQNLTAGRRPGTGHWSTTSG